MSPEEFSLQSSGIPHLPGIYKYFDASGKLLYVGKAKDLRKRVGSYFNKSYPNYKTKELVTRIHHIEFTIVDSEQDAFLLENALIKQFKPRYNIDLKDDKTYPYIVFKKEAFPRVFLTRRKIPDGSEYLGPFTSVGRVRELLDFIRTTIPLRTCKLNLTPGNINQGKFKVCLEYHLGNCLGPCEGLQSEADYQEGLQQIRQILKGNVQPVVQHFKKQMQEFVQDMAFEKAEIVRQKIVHLEQYNAKSVVVSKYLGHVDVFSIRKEGEQAYVNYLMVQNGTIVQTHTIELEAHLEETEAEVLSYAIQHLRETFNSLATEMVVPFPIEFPLEGIQLVLPKAGDRKKLLELSQKNVDYFLEESRRRKMLHLKEKTEADMEEILLQLQDDLELDTYPQHIECFDNSNFQGSYPVSAMVCFKNGLPSKKDYRHFHVKTVQGINDFATMKEVVSRRYKRLLEENQPFPSLIIIDGGKGQLGAAMEALRQLGAADKTTVVGLAKNEEEIFFPGNPDSLKLPWSGTSLQLIRRIRDEVHRFGITFHRQIRSKGTFKNELENIDGIGTQSAENLLKKFKSVKNVAAATVEEIAEIVGKKRAELIKSHFSTPGN